MLKNLVYFAETSAAEPEYAMMHALSPNLELPEMHRYSPQSPDLVIPPPLTPLSPISQLPPIPSQLPQPPAPQPQAPASLNHAVQRNESCQPRISRKCRWIFWHWRRQKWSWRLKTLDCLMKKRGCRLKSFWQDASQLH